MPARGYISNAQDHFQALPINEKLGLRWSGMDQT